MTVLRSAPAPPPGWDDFASRFSPLVFFRTRWRAALEKGYGARVRYDWLERDGAVAAGAVVAQFRFPFLRFAYAGLPYGAVLGAPEDAARFLAAWIPHMRGEGFHAIRIPATSDDPVLEDFGFVPRWGPRHSLDLDPFAGLAQFRESLPYSVRKCLRKGERESVETAAAETAHEVRAAHAIYLAAMAAKGAPAKYPEGRFLSVFEHLAPAGLGAVLVARRAGRVVGANLLVASDDSVHDLQLCDDPDFRPYRVADALVFASIAWTMRIGRRRFDFMGSPPGDESLARFKEKWGARRREAPVYTLALSPVRAGLADVLHRLAAHPLGARLSRYLRAAPVASDAAE